MRHLTLLLLVVATLRLSAQQITRLDGSRIGTQDLEKHITALMDSAKVTGLEIAVLQHNKPLYVHAFGYADKEKQRMPDTSTIFWACSLSKAVFGYCVLKLVDQGVISLDTPLQHYLKKPLPDYVFTKKTRGYQDIRDDKRYEKITARMCLDHTTGLPNYRGFEPNGKLSIRTDPGTRYGYSGEGMFLLQFVLEQVTGKGYEELAQENVFKPLGMTHSSYIWQDAFEANHAEGHDSTQKVYEFDRRTLPHSAGSMYTSIDDYTKFMTVMMQRKGLSEKSFKEMLSPQIAILSKKQFGPDALVDDKTPQQTKLFYGLGVGLLKTPYGTAFFKEGHSEGWSHYSIGYPDKGLAIVIFTNSDYGTGIYKPLLGATIGDLYTAWDWEGYAAYNGK